MTEIKVPPLGESVSEATVGKWHKKEGDPVKSGEVLVELETDKITLEVNADVDGTLQSIKTKEGSTVKVGALLGDIKAGGVPKQGSVPVKNEPKSVEPEIRPDNLSPATRKIVEEKIVE